MSAVLPDRLAQSLEVAAQAPARPLDLVSLGIIRDKVVKARLYLHEARLHARGCPEALEIIDAAGWPCRAAQERFEAAYVRGKL